MGACNMKKTLLLLPVAAMWSCTDYAGQWEDSYGIAFAQSSTSEAQVCTDGATTSVEDEYKCVTSFLCANNAWIPQNYICSGQTQQKICDEGVTTYFVDGNCTNYFVCKSNTWVYVGAPVCTTPVASSSSKAVVKSSSSVKKSSSSVKKSSSSKAKSSSSVKKSSSSKAKSCSLEKGTNFEPWMGVDFVEQVNTGLDNGSCTSGYWFTEDDHDDGGGSKVVWKVEPGTEYNENSLAPVIEACSGICGTAVLDKGTLTYNPFIDIGFNVAGVGADGEPEAADASDWGGLCITYMVETGATLELGLGSTVDASFAYANPFASLPKSVTGSMKAIPWSGFTQPSWYKGNNKIDGPTAASQLVAVKFRIQAVPGEYQFNITSIGSFNGSCTAAF